MPKVSIIIAIYNVEKYLKQCLDSVVNQTLKDIEIICVNDGSTDGSLYILKEYAAKDNRFKIITQVNKGAGIARNEAINIATGDYIMILDPDDWLELNACELAYNQISKNQNDFVIFNYYNYYETTSKKTLSTSRIRPFKNYYNLPNIELKNLNNDFIQKPYTCTQIYSRNFITNNEIKYSNEKLGEDLYFYIKAIINAKNISILDKALYNYRIRKNSSVQSYITNWQNLITVRYKGLELVNNCNKNYINAYLIYSITSLYYWYKKSLTDKTLNKKFYKDIQQFFNRVLDEYDLGEVKTYINYKKIKKICYTSWEYLCFKNFIKNLFSMINIGKYKVITILGIKFKFRRTKKIMKNKTIFTFWEPKNKIPAYLKLCMATWKKFLPEYEILILDYSNLEDYLGKNFYNKTLYKDYSLPKQADAIRCALLEKYGGIWFDCDTIITSDDFRKFLEIRSECIMLGWHIGFIIAKPHAKLLKKWLNGIKRNLFLHEHCKKSRIFKNIINLINREYVKNLDKWDFMGNSILNKYLKTFPQNLFYSIDRIKYNALPEVIEYPEDPTKAYRTYYFKDNLANKALANTSGLIYLHNSWTPKEYREMAVEEFLKQEITLAKIFKKILTPEEIQAVINETKNNE